MLKDTSSICKYALLGFLFPEMPRYQCLNIVTKQLNGNDTINRVTEHLS